MKHLVIIVTALVLLVAAPAAHAAPAGQTQPTFGRGWSLPTYGKGSSRPTFGRGWSLEALEVRHTPRER